MKLLLSMEHENEVYLHLHEMSNVDIHLVDHIIL